MTRMLRKARLCMPLLAALAACGGGKAKLGESCGDNDACPVGAVCYFGKCRSLCAGIADCAQDQICNEEGVCVGGAGECTADADCDTPTSACHDSPGTCLGGACTYAPKAEGAACNASTAGQCHAATGRCNADLACVPDLLAVGTPCSGTDPCFTDYNCDATGQCTGTPLSCMTPPAPFCLDQAHVQTYKRPGRCNAGVCEYTALTANCYSGCTSDTSPCLADVCANTDLRCQADVCMADGVCDTDGYCFYSYLETYDSCDKNGDAIIDGICMDGQCDASVCMPPGASAPFRRGEPLDSCYRCNPDVDRFAWSEAAVGAPCTTAGANGVCVDDPLGAPACDGAHCFIDGSLVPAGGHAADSTCRVCDPTESSQQWTLLPEMERCADGVGLCMDGECYQGCSINGELKTPGEPAPDNSCQICDPRNPFTWEPRPTVSQVCTLPDGTNGLCFEGQCTSMCYLGGPVASGEASEDGCSVCDPTQAVLRWTPANEGDPCVGKAGFCSSGSCVTACSIGGVLYRNGEVNPVNECQWCNTAVSLSDWTPRTPYSYCDDGRGLCDPNDGTCNANICYIDATRVSYGTLEASGCRICYPGQNRKGWTFVEDGRRCGSTGHCVLGGCVANTCWIGERLYNNGVENPLNSCQLCNATYDLWMPKPDDSNCSATSTGCKCYSGVKKETGCFDTGVGADNDGDGFINCLDSDCLGESCSNAIAVVLPAVADTWVSDSGGSRCDVDRICAGRYSGESFHTYVRFDALAGYGIDSATLVLRSASGSCTGKAYLVTQPWDEASLLWSSQPLHDAEPAIDPVNNNGCRWDITPFFRRWSNNAVGTYGVVILDDSGSSFNMVEYYSRESTVGSERPKVEVSYRNVCTVNRVCGKN